MGKLFAPIIDKTITAFTDNSCEVKYYLPEGADGVGIISRITTKSEKNGNDVISYQFTNGINNKKIDISLEQDFVIQLYLVSDELETTTDIEAWLKSSENKEKYSASSDPVAFWHVEEISTNIEIDNQNIHINKIGIIPEISLIGDELSEFQIQIKNKNDTFLVDSGTLYPQSNNKLITFSLSGLEYYTNSPKVILNYRTKKGYVGSESKDIEDTSHNYSNLNTQLIFSYSTDITKNIITIKKGYNNSNTYEGYLYRRHKNEKGVWVEQVLSKDKKTITGIGGTSWEDYSVEFNKFYIYSFRTDKGIAESSYIKPDNGHMYLQEYELDSDIKIISGTKSLCIKFNPEVSGIKTNKTEQVISTFGKYPFIARSGDTNYKTFTIGGLISVEANDDFVADINITGDDYDARVIKEKLYRDAVLVWLHEPKIRRFISGPEGVCYVYLSNISLSPDKVSGRNLYSFSCQATEVADPEAEGYALVTI